MTKGHVVELPVDWVNGGHVAEVCCRHGEPSAGTRPVRLVSRIRAEDKPFFIFGPFGWVLAMLKRDHLTVPAWPFCLRCRDEHWLATVFATVVVGLGVAMMVFAAVIQLIRGVPEANGVGGYLDTAPGGLLLGGLLVIAVGYGVIRLWSWQRLTRAVVHPERHTVLVRRAHSTFVEDAYAALDAARQAAERQASTRQGSGPGGPDPH